MRTTITLDPDVALLVEQAMKERNAKFKDVVNELIRRGAGAVPAAETPLPTLSLGQPLVDLTFANSVIEQMEDDERIRAMQVGR